ncbi:MAG TPA: protein kinase [Longimicrobium sp.]|nr:protein kinase [Longimicrobium sp.]
MSSPESPVSGRVLGRRLGGRYHVQATVAAGGMGAVFRALDERLGRAVALKVIGLDTDDPALAAELRRWFQREARAAAALRHPNVVTVHDFGSDAELDLDYLVMELLPGRDVAGRLAEAGGPLSVAETMEIFREAGMGLAAGHRAGIVHRDVKPRNIFLVDDPDGGWEVKVLDFGIADAVDARATTVPGRPAPHTPRYAAPEQLRGEAATAASDVYSLGLTALEMLCGDPPEALRGAADAGPASRTLAGLCAADRALRPAIADVLLRAVHPDPARRFADAGQLLRALEPALGMSSGAVMLPSALDATDPGKPSASAEATSLHADADPTALLQEPARPLPSALTAGLARRAATERPSSSRPAGKSGGKGVPIAVRLAIAMMLLILFGPLLVGTVRDGVRELRGASQAAARNRATESLEVAREEYDRVTRMNYSAGALLQFQGAAFPWEQEEQARAVVSEFRSRRVPAGVGSHDVYPPLPPDHVYALVGPLRESLSPEERALLDELAARYGVTFIPMSLVARQPE